MECHDSITIWHWTCVCIAVNLTPSRVSLAPTAFVTKQDNVVLA